MIRCYGLIILSIAFAFISCKHSDEPELNVVAKGNRKLGIHVTATENFNYNTEIGRATDAGMDIIPLSFYWGEVESVQGFNFTNVDISNAYYPTFNIPVYFVVSPIYAANKSFPPDLEGKSFNDPIVISRFKALLDSIHKRTPAVDLYAVLMANEADLYLNQHPDEWDDYTQFYEQVSAHARALWKNKIKIGTEITFSSLKGTYQQEIKTLNETSDFLATTYYPLNSDFTVQDPSAVKNDLKTMVEFMPGKLVFIEETGYQTSAQCNSSDEKQAEFISTVFSTWDQYGDKIDYIGFLWLTDLSDKQASDVAATYGISTGDPLFIKFKEYLRSLGLRTFPGNGMDKKGFVRLKEETLKRNW